jgi:hypothetical protein
MDQSPYTLRVEREDGELLVLDGLALVRGFIAGDPSAQPGGYDSRAGAGDPERISKADVTTMNQTMRARSGHKYWAATYADPQEWLAAIALDLDLIETDDAEWNAARGDDLVADVINRCVQPGIGLAGATKLLHLKRPRLFPVLDSLVVEVMGINVGDDATREQRIAIAQQVAAAIRREGRRNIDALRAIQAEVGDGGRLRLTLVRILDICLWFAHPAAGVPGALREIRVGMR